MQESVYPYINGRGVALDNDGGLILSPPILGCLEERFVHKKIIQFWENFSPKTDYSRVSIVITDLDYPMYYKTISLSCDDISCISFWRQGLIVYDSFPFLENTVLVDSGRIRYKDYINFNVKNNKNINENKRIKTDQNAQKILPNIDMRKIYDEKYFLGVTDGLIDYEVYENFFISYRFYHSVNAIKELSKNNKDFVEEFKIFSKPIALERISSIQPMEFECTDLIKQKYIRPNSSIN